MIAPEPAVEVRLQPSAEGALKGASCAAGAAEGSWAQLGDLRPRASGAAGRPWPRGHDKPSGAAGLQPSPDLCATHRSPLRLCVCGFGWLAFAFALGTWVQRTLRPARSAVVPFRPLAPPPSPLSRALGFFHFTRCVLPWRSPCSCVFLPPPFAGISRFSCSHRFCFCDFVPFRCFVF